MFEFDLIPYAAVTEIKASRVLVLAPHPDDEVFGCGGAIANHIAHGIKVEVVILTHGGGGGDATIRQEESLAAAACLGYGEPEFWNLTDRELSASLTISDRLSELIITRGIDLLYAPSPWEIHPDHRACSELALQAIKLVGTKCRLAFYEVGAPLRPNTVLDITSHALIKRAAIECFASQLSNQNYCKQILGLNSFRTYTMPEEVEYAEAFLLLSANELELFIRCQRYGLVSWGVNSANQQAQASPLVSILIRSTGRRYLYEALNSISLQTWPNIEVVVVAAIPNHPELPRHIGGYQINLIRSDTAIGKSRAANLALHSASGEFLIFLDDDDWIMPDHIARLARALIVNRSALAAYTGVVLVDHGGKPLSQTFDLPFDYIQQRAGNLTPIHAVLFEASLLNKGLIFDEKIEIFEDWDFWLQLAQLTPLLHIPGISAVYRVHDSSGVHRTPMIEHETAQHIQLQWSNREPVSQQDLFKRVWAYNDLELKNNSTEDALSNANHEIESMRNELKRILNSKSWQITKPLRLLSIFLRTLLSYMGQANLVRLYEHWKRAGTSATIRKILFLLTKKSPINNKHYRKWFNKQQSHQPDALEILRARQMEWGKLPLISVIMPVYNPPINFLEAAITSITNQIYSNWELCISDDASTDPEVWGTLQKFSANDARIKIIRRSENGHISVASNTALSIASGEFIILMDNDDLVSADALHWVADTINQNPSVNVIYSDEDKIDINGEHFGPYFKPDWNYTLFMGHNLISHLGAYRTSLVREIGGFREGMEGSQDYDLALRCIERSLDTQIAHIPKILYHWRAIEGSTALSTDSKPYAVYAAKRALEEHRLRICKPCHVEILPTYNYRIHRPIIKQQLKITLILWSPNLSSAQRGTKNTAETNFFDRFDEVIESSSELDKLNSAINNARGELIVLCRRDISPSGPVSVEEIIQLALEEETGLAAGTVRSKRGFLVSGGLILNHENFASVLMHDSPKGDHGYMGRLLLAQELSAVSINCVAFRKNVFNKSNGFNPKFSHPQVGMVDLCLKLKSIGHRIIWQPSAEWVCSDDKASNLKEIDTSLITTQEVIKSNIDFFLNDPAYHIALDPTASNFTFRSYQ